MREALQAILVTGSSWSGLAWAGKILVSAPHTGYLREPFNTGIPA